MLVFCSFEVMFRVGVAAWMNNERCVMAASRAPRCCPLRMALHSRTSGANRAKPQDETSRRHNGFCSWNKRDEKAMMRDLQTRLFFFVGWGVGLLCVNVGRFVLCNTRPRLLICRQQKRKRLHQNAATNSYAIDSSQTLSKNNYKK